MKKLKSCLSNIDEGSMHRKEAQLKKINQELKEKTLFYEKELEETNSVLLEAAQKIANFMAEIDVSYLIEVPC